MENETGPIKKETSEELLDYAFNKTQYIHDIDEEAPNNLTNEKLYRTIDQLAWAVEKLALIISKNLREEKILK